MIFPFTAYLFPVLFSGFFVLVMSLVFRAVKIGPRLIEFVIGATVISAAAIFLETYLFSVVGTLLGVLIIAPILEESLKFLGTARKRDRRSGIGIGLGFAFVENMLYFHAFLTGYSVTSIISYSFIASQIFLFITMRGIFDPMLHSSLAGISSVSWQRGRRHWLFVAISLHVAYNFVAVLGQTNVQFLAIFDSVVVGAALFLLFRKSAIKGIAQKAIEPEVGHAVETKAPIVTEPVKIITDISNMSLEDQIEYYRKTSKVKGFTGIAQELELDTHGYTKSKWIRRAILVQSKARSSFTEICIYGMLLIAAMVGLGGIAVWVLFL